VIWRALCAAGFVALIVAAKVIADLRAELQRERDFEPWGY
jgi:hypothetical protein